MILPEIDDYELLEKVFDAVPENIGIIDSDYNIIKYNKHLKDFLDIKEDSAKNKKCYEIFGCNDICKDCKITEVLETKKQVSNEFFLEARNVWVRQHFSPVFNKKNELVCVVEHIQDISEFRNNEAELKRQNRELIISEEEIRINNEELNASNEALQESKEKLEIANAQLQASRKQYQQLFDNMLDGFALHEIILDENDDPIDYKFIDVNPAFERITGLKKENLVNRKVMEVLPGTEKIWIEKYGHVALTGEPLEIENFSSEIGRYFHVTAFSPEKNRFATIFEDVTERIIAQQRLEESEKRYRSMFNENLSMMLLVDPENGDIVDANPMACEFYGYNDHQIRRMKIFDINVWDKNQTIHKMHDTQEGASHIFLARHKKQNGDIRDVRVSSSPLKINGKTVLYSIIQDVTAEIENRNKLIEKERELEKQNVIIKEQNEEYASVNEEYLTANEELSEQIEKHELLNKQYKELNKRLVEKNEELRIALQKAAESDKLKTSFLANMSHEIRTPMNGIIGFTELLQNNNLTLDKKNQYIDIIKSSTNQLLTIINDVIDVSKIEANQLTLDFTEVNINEILQKIQMQFWEQLKLQQKEQIDLQLVIPKGNTDNSMYVVDDVRLTQILHNLLTNAIKFTFQGHVRFGYRDDKGGVLFFVEDTGKGIARDKLKIIFERFRQEEESFTRSYSGFGLGLTISKGLVELFGGDIWVESQEGKGSAFYFWVPLKKVGSNLHEAVDNSMQAEIQKPLKVLIVEDDATSRILMAEFLKSTNCTCYNVDNGIKAIEFMKKNPDTDLIFMDIQLPIMDGYKATSKIREINKSVKIVAQTANAMISDKEKALKSGCDDYVAKPVTQQKINEILLHHFSA